MSNPYSSQQPGAPKSSDTRPAYKRKRVWAGGIAALIVLGAIVDNGDDAKETASPAPAVTVTQTADPATPADDDAKEPAAEDVPEGDSGTGILPDMVGKDLQAAQDEAQDAGFWTLDDQDASGQARLQIYDRNWTVCSQTPKPGRRSLDTPVTFYAVKDNESC
jgi:hypothetical protein